MGAGFIAVFLSVFLARSIHAEVREVVSVNPDARLFSYDNNYLESRDAFYREFFGALDPTIRQSFEDQWRFHDYQIRYETTRWKGEFFTIGSLDYYGRRASEHDVRSAMAKAIFNNRTRLAIQHFLTSQHRPKAVRKSYAVFNQAWNALRDTPISFSSDPYMRFELHLGYDFLTDAAKIEFFTEWLSAGIYHPSLTGSLLGSGPFLERFLLNMSANLGKSAFNPSFSYHLFGDSFAVTLSRDLGPFATSLTRVQPLKTTVSERYELRLALSF